MGRHAGERQVRRLEDQIAFMETQRSRAQRRHQRAVMRAQEARSELIDYDGFLSDLRAARSELLPGGVNAERRRRGVSS